MIHEIRKGFPAHTVDIGFFHKIQHGQNGVIFIIRPFSNVNGSIDPICVNADIGRIDWSVCCRKQISPPASVGSFVQRVHLIGKGFGKGIQFFTIELVAAHIIKIVCTLDRIASAFFPKHIKAGLYGTAGKLDAACVSSNGIWIRASTCKLDGNVGGLAAVGRDIIFVRFYRLQLSVVFARFRTLDQRHFL